MGKIYVLLTKNPETWLDRSSKEKQTLLLCGYFRAFVFST